MNQETKSSSELRFVCPQCGSKSLWAWGPGWLEIKHVYDNGVLSWGSIEPEEISEYHCRKCGHELEFGEDEGIVEWLIAHCDQDAVQAGQAEEENSEVPPAKES